MSRFLLALSLIAWTAHAAPSDEPYLAISRPLPAGARLGADDLMTKWGRPLPLSRLVLEHQRTWVIGQILLEPVSEGEPLRPTQLTSSRTFENWRDYCAFFPEPLRSRGAPDKKYPEPSDDMSRSLLVATRSLPAGAVLAKSHLAPRDPDGAIGPYAATSDRLDLVLGKRLVAPLVAGESLRYPQLVEFAKEPRCNFLFQAYGNLWEKLAPAVEPTRCTGQALVGVPGGAAWNQTFPGWASVCKDASGVRNGPYAAWHRTSEKIAERGQFAAGKRGGAWGRYDDKGRPIQETNYVGGLLEGAIRRLVYSEYMRADPVGTPVVQGFFRESAMHDSWTFSFPDGTKKLVADFWKGGPAGTWRWFDENGVDIGSAAFGSGLAHGSWTLADQAGRTRATIGYSEGKPVSIPPGTPMRELLVAARPIAPGTKLAASDLARLQVPAALVLDELVTAERASEFIGRTVAVAVPARAPMFELMFSVETPAAGVDPVPLAKR